MPSTTLTLIFNHTHFAPTSLYPRDGGYPPPTGCPPRTCMFWFPHPRFTEPCAWRLHSVISSKVVLPPLISATLRLHSVILQVISLCRFYFIVSSSKWDSRLDFGQRCFSRHIGEIF